MRRGELRKGREGRRYRVPTGRVGGAGASPPGNNRKGKVGKGVVWEGREGKWGRGKRVRRKE